MDVHGAGMGGDGGKLMDLGLGSPLPLPSPASHHTHIYQGGTQAAYNMAQPTIIYGPKNEFELLICAP